MLWGKHAGQRPRHSPSKRFAAGPPVASADRRRGGPFDGRLGQRRGLADLLRPHAGWRRRAAWRPKGGAKGVPGRTRGAQGVCQGLMRLAMRGPERAPTGQGSARCGSLQRPLHDGSDIGPSSARWPTRAVAAPASASNTPPAPQNTWSPSVLSKRPTRVLTGEPGLPGGCQQPGRSARRPAATARPGGKGGSEGPRGAKGGPRGGKGGPRGGQEEARRSAPERILERASIRHSRASSCPGPVGVPRHGVGDEAAASEELNMTPHQTLLALATTGSDGSIGSMRRQLREVLDLVSGRDQRPVMERKRNRVSAWPAGGPTHAQGPDPCWLATLIGFTGWSNRRWMRGLFRGWGGAPVPRPWEFLGPYSLVSGIPAPGCCQGGVAAQTI